MENATNFWQNIFGADFWTTIGAGALQIVLILLLAVITVNVVKKVVDRTLKKRQKGRIKISERRMNTVTRLIKNVVSYVVYFIAIVMILGVFGVQLGPIIAGAGVLGLAIGFGAQNLVRDIISGFFIIFEDQFSVGDYIAVAGIEGTVEEIGLRTSKILSWTGEMNIIPNGAITQVTNYSLENGLAVVDVNIPYESDVEKAEGIISELAQKLPEKYDYMVTVPEIIGVQTLDVSHYALRIKAETEPAMQFAGQRDIRRDVQDQLYKSGIEIPSPRIVMYSGEADDKTKLPNQGEGQERATE